MNFDLIVSKFIFRSSTKDSKKKKEKKRSSSSEERQKKEDEKSEIERREKAKKKAKENRGKVKSSVVVPVNALNFVLVIIMVFRKRAKKKFQSQLQI